MFTILRAKTTFILIIVHTHTHTLTQNYLTTFDFFGVFLEHISEFVPSGSPLPQKCIIQHTSSLLGFIFQLCESALQNNILPGATYCRQQPDLPSLHNNTKQRLVSRQLGLMVDLNFSI